MPTQGPTLMPHTPEKETTIIPIATPSPRKNAWTEQSPINRTDETNELDKINQKMDADIKEWRDTAKNLEKRQHEFQTQVNTSVKNLHRLITDQQSAFCNMQSQMESLLKTQNYTMSMIGDIHTSIKNLTNPTSTDKVPKPHSSKSTKPLE